MAQKKIKIVEVGPRDGLQNEAIQLSVSHRVELIEKLIRAGIHFVEVGAFVSPEWVPQMANSDQVIAALQKKGLLKKADCSALVPNPRGMEDALKTSIQHIAVFGACSETFSKKNINCSIDESFQRFEDVIKMAKKHKINVRGYLSTAFGCPYEGVVSEAQVLKLVGRMLKLGVSEVSIGDTIGVGTPKQVESLLKKVEKKYGLKKIAMHFHDTRGTALANVLASLKTGVSTFDASVGGLGGCPYAKGASGNLATEDLIYMLHGMGYKTGIQLDRLIETARWVEQHLGRPLPSRMAKAGLPLRK
ncbi:MAG: hydroxymethylglutaryl-CoA lyase [Bdellovibrionales bacterium]|nr:hydroxymethylglutaryl-CoA lyase [Bdellovibrionales bacterium]